MEYSNEQFNQDTFQKSIGLNPDSWSMKLEKRKEEAQKVLDKFKEHKDNFTIDSEYGKITCKFTGH